MIRSHLAIAAVFAAVLFAGAAPASASVCTSDCGKAYTDCSNANGISGQTVCTPKWMQCKKACAGPVTPAKTSPVKMKASAKPTSKVTKVATASVKKP